MKKLFVARDEVQALFIKGQLESVNIKVVIVTSNDSYLPGIIGVSNGRVPYDIFVSESDLAQAVKILKEKELH